MDAGAEPVRTGVNAWRWVTSVPLACLIAGLELLLDQSVGTGELVGIGRAFVFHLEEALVVLMGLVAELVVAGEFSLEMAKGVEIVEWEELLADAFHHSVVALPVAGHSQLLFIWQTGRIAQQTELTLLFPFLPKPYRWCLPRGQCTTTPASTSSIATNPSCSTATSTSSKT